MRIRPLQSDDVPAAAACTVAALPAHPDEADAQAWVERRVRHLRATDPDGTWVAEVDGEVIGVALALVRDGIWGLSLLAVRPDRQSQGAGRALIAAALGTAERARGALIASSTDPKAMRAYARAGFDLRPCVSAAGVVDRSRIPAGLRAAPTGDVEAALAVSGRVRGGAYEARDLLTLGLDQGLLALDGRGFAVHRGGAPRMVCAADDAAAVDLLWSCLAETARGATIDVDLITAGQDWAIRAALDAGLDLSPDGPVFTRGRLGPLRPWIPSGALL